MTTKNSREKPCDLGKKHSPREGAKGNWKKIRETKEDHNTKPYSTHRQWLEEENIKGRSRHLKGKCIKYNANEDFGGYPQ